MLTLVEAIAGVALRGRLMEEACAAGEGDWGMAAVTGLPTRAAAQLTQQVGTDGDPLWVANINGATQPVFSGTAVALHKAADAAKTPRPPTTNDSMWRWHRTARCRRAPQPGWRAHLADLPRRTPTARYLTNTRGRAAITAEAVLDDLARAVAHPVQWYDATRLMCELGATCAVETQPGHVLTRLLHSAAPTVVSISLQDNPFAADTARRSLSAAAGRR